MNWTQILGNDSTLTNLAQQAVGASPSVIDQTKLDFLSDPSVAQAEIVLVDGSLGPSYPAPGDPLYGADFLTLIGIAMRPLARGSVHVATADVASAPVIDPRYLDSAYDLQSLIELGRYMRRIAAGAPLAGLLAGEHLGPGAGMVDDNDDDDDAWEAYVRDAMMTIWHYAGSCAMLPLEDGGVVDPRLRVWGTSNLRVVDASVAPVLVASHTQTMVYGIAERAAEIIIEDYAN